MMEEITWGRNPVLEALNGPRSLNRVLIARGSHGRVKEIVDLARSRGIPVQIVERQVLDRLTGGAGHQGVVAYLSPKQYASLEEILKNASEREEPPLLLMLAGWEDPQNFGSILRSAEAAGVHGVIIPERRAVPLTGTVAKASAGAVEFVSVCRVRNLSQTLRELKDTGLWVAGADPTGSLQYFEADLTVPIVVVVGGEGKGLGHLAKSCDYLVRLPMRGRVDSLNAAVAGSIILYEALRQRIKGLDH